jgi:uncharacterized protein YbaR (Trm112 family)
MIDKKLLALLACPACQGDVELESKTAQAPKIVCTRCHRSYPIIDGIPVLLADQASLP